MIDVAIYGASGYGGQELLRLLWRHPHVRVTAVTSGRLAGKLVADELPQLAGFYDLAFTSPDEPVEAEILFFATPHGVTRELLPAVRGDRKVIDLSRDFRDDDAFVYGLTETARDRVRTTVSVANPGCFATGALLALAPLAEEGLLRGDVTLAQTTGSSGSGASATAGTHHPERAQDQRAYKVLTHQHEAEIVAELGRLGATDVDLGMIPQSGAFARGIFTVAHVRAAASEVGDVADLCRERYRDEPFVRLREDTPALRHVTRTNFCDLAVHQRDGRVVVLTAIDNLGKGMAGQAIQNLNLLCGFEETAGLLEPGANP